jgi:hypothetical protein
MVVQASSAILFFLLPVVTLTVVAYLVMGDTDPLPLIPLYLGLPNDLSLSVADAALGIVPRFLLLPFVVLSPYSLAMLVGTYARWKPVFYLLLAGGAVRFAAAVAAFIFGGYYGRICGGAGVLLALASFYVIFQLEDDFFSDLERIHFQVGGKSKTGVSLLLRGRNYAKQKMWALAALHLRQAAADMVDRTEAHWHLAMAYMHLERHDLADQVLLEAERIRPNDPQIQELRELLASHQVADRRRS